MSFNPTSIFSNVVEAGNDWADKEAAAGLLEETKKVTLAELTQAGIASGKSKAAAEVEAQAHTDYVDHIVKMVAARKEANRAKVKYYAVQALGENRKTEHVTKRAELQSLPGTM